LALSAILRAWVAPFGVRSFRFQWPADLASSWAFEMETLILGWYVLVETGSVELLALFGFLLNFGTLISPLFGAIGDRIGHRNLLCAMRATYCVLAIGLMTLAFTGLLAPLPVFIVATVAGMVRSSDFVLRNVLVAETIPAANFTGAMSLLRTTADSARIVGALAGAGLVTTFGMGAAYVVVSAFYLISLALTFGVGDRSSQRVSPKITAGFLTPASLWRDLADSMVYMRARPDLLVMMFLAFLINFAAFPFVGGLLPYVAKEIYHLDQTGLGTLVAGYASGALLGSLALSAFGAASRPARMSIVFSVVWYCLLLVFARLDNVIAGVVVLFLSGFVQSLCMIMLSVAMLRGADPQFRGRVMSMRTLAVYGLPLGLLAAGLLIDRLGFAMTATVYCGIGIVLTLLVTIRWCAHLWRIESPANAR
jgi:predicted MFS family arabinose efflux permease